MKIDLKQIQPEAKSGVYSNSEIEAAINIGHIVCHPLIKENINGSSLDITLGHWYYRTDRHGQSGFYNHRDPADIKRYFGEHQKAIPNNEWAAKHNKLPFKNIPKDHPIIVIGPGERILAHTHEFVGINPPGTTSMQARSTIGRNGITVCKDAGWGDPGYTNRWTMEIKNENLHESVVFAVGERVAQIIFMHTGAVKGEYATLSGNYQSNSGTELQTMVESWRPWDMLPKAPKELPQKPIPIEGIYEG